MAGRRPLSNERGQMVVEMVLLALMTMGFIALLLEGVGEMGIARNLVGEPWSRMAGMIESGVWEPARVAKRQHPNHKQRGISLRDN